MNHNSVCGSVTGIRRFYLDHNEEGVALLCEIGNEVYTILSIDFNTGKLYRNMYVGGRTGLSLDKYGIINMERREDD